jgi:putative ABC transport system substrate-binding protein
MTGLVANLARPGGNVTGLSTISAVLSAKRLELLREIVPTITRVAVLWDDSNPAFKLAVQQTETAARLLGISIEAIGLHAAGGFDNAIAAVVGSGAQGLILAVSVDGAAPRLTAMLERRRLPTVYLEKEYVQLGGLLSYGASNVDLLRRAATYADQILRGASPPDLPVQEQTKFEFSVNLKTAKAIDLTIPPPLLAIADEVIE